MLRLYTFLDEKYSSKIPLYHNVAIKPIPKDASKLKIKYIITYIFFG
jgi:hypothetical protein